MPPPPDGETVNRVRTELSATLFSGEPQDWVRYLSKPAVARYEPQQCGVLQVAAGGVASIEPTSESAAWFCSLLSAGFAQMRNHVGRKPNVLACYEQLLRGGSHGRAPVTVHVGRNLPTSVTIEATLAEEPADVRIVLNRTLLLALADGLRVSDLTEEEGLALLWPVLSRVVGHIGFPLEVRDVYAAKVEVVAKLAYVAVNVMYESEEHGQLRATPCGQALERVLAHTGGLSRKEARENDGYLRFLRRLGFVLRAKPYASYAEELKVAARGYLDTRYLRLSLSGAMPDLDAWKQPMHFDVTQRKFKPSTPRVGRHGIATSEDLEGWLEIVKPLREQGFILLRQLGVGDFGRVYEAHNSANPQYPQRVAIKVDKIFGKKKRAILEAEAAMRIGRDLATANHLIRIYDTGKVQGRRFTYHVLQLVDGETIDELVGSLEVEHVSLAGPPDRRTTLADLRREFAQRLGIGRAKTKPVRSGAVPFRFGLSPAMLMDLVTGMLLCLEEVHSLGYAMNDLKNDNLMLSRRGQLKGIDLDSFSRITSPLDKCTDFMFLATSLILVVLHAATPGGGREVGNWHDLLADEIELRRAIADVWPSSLVERLGDGRVGQAEVVEILATLVLRCKNLQYAMDPDEFTRDISRIVALKRRLLQEDLVLD